MIDEDCLSAQQQLNDDETEATSPQKIIEIALRYLSRREYSEIELKKKILLKNQFSTEDLAEAFDILKENNYLSEERYIRQKTNLLKLKGFSSSYIAKSLNRENIPVDLEIINEFNFVTNETNLLKLLNKKLKGVPFNLLEPNKKKSIIRYLMTKGYSYDEIKTTLKYSTQDV